jgi:cytochrome c oxidase assembly factor CtaG
MFSLSYLKFGFLALVTPQLWYAVPLIVSISLVWGATRHERLREIIIHSVRSLLWVLTFMGLVFALIYFSGYFTQ